LEIIRDPKTYFDLSEASPNHWILQTSKTTNIDREDPEILLNGGVYQIELKATEIANLDNKIITGESAFVNIQHRAVNDAAGNTNHGALLKISGFKMKRDQ